ncbi:OprD family porin [Pseudomonas fluorescens]|uniref:Porin-like protein NicP n=1 Tax=Pseudomonas fluorescens TaxID=294 RepID=A0A5E6ZQ34_PSEFL|nr:OprD family porin [Pseudomonas fluorescens]VVN68690.1 Porin-like protein NicP [Pseudomonas fluorescens]
MKNRVQKTPPLLLGIAILQTPLSALAAGGFIEGSSATLQARNYYFSRDFSDIVGPNQQSKAQEWGQGFILNVKSGYTPGVVGFGVDAIGLLGLKLDSSPDRVKTGLLPVHGDGKAADEYSRLGLAFKAKLSNSELKIGELQPNLPVLTFSDTRLLPPSYQGASLVSNEIDGLTLQAGQLHSTSLRDEAGDEKMQAMVGSVVKRQASADHFNYAGADYAFNDKRTSAGAWYAQLEDLYNQRFFSLKHSQPLGDWTLGASIGYYDSSADGKKLIGEVDNQALHSLLSAKYGGHTVSLGYQAMFGDQGFARVFANVSPLSNEVMTYAFDSIDERSMQARYDYNFAALGIPGLTTMVRYVKGDNVTTVGGFEGQEWERDLDIGYVIQSGPLKNLGILARNATARSNYRSDVNENRLILNYTLALF